ncbi:hypothetical protein Sru01_45380 [Sphaerisporangium rufum]|uniref:Ferric siderophore reductase C-terminal domain-containing protein n=1 Tax=Sphaerisporangium rufum TaxID=1381558 RepID=A0A919UZY8_9ACTN|nr:(2Fe-2S)-binding protein [Sphaerisporangium rufum]GII79556.1 hypothetical protein Sru01_45380 [Sphaerisporangium rufum]
MAVGRALAEVSAFGPYFAVEPAGTGRTTGPGERDGHGDGDGRGRAAGPGGAGWAGAAGDGGDGWRPMAELATDTAALRARIADFARRLGTGEPRVAASILFQGLAARLWSPVVGTVTARGLVPVDAAGCLRWRPAATGPLPLRAAAGGGWLAVPADLPAGRVAGLVYDAVVPGLLAPLADAVRDVVKIPAAVLWGNAASALAGTLRTLPPVRPDLGPAAARLVAGVVRLGLLAGTGEPAEPAPGVHFFVRTSCCLYYRVPGGGLCDDCALVRPPDRAAAWARAARAAGAAARHAAGGAAGEGADGGREGRGTDREEAGGGAAEGTDGGREGPG